MGIKRNLDISAFCELLLAGPTAYVGCLGLFQKNWQVSHRSASLPGPKRPPGWFIARRRRTSPYCNCAMHVMPLARDRNKADNFQQHANHALHHLFAISIVTKMTKSCSVITNESGTCAPQITQTPGSLLFARDGAHTPWHYWTGKFTDLDAILNRVTMNKHIN